ncbi:MAG: tRNA (adenosine(37)-N6)-threonylcarbamoyltransferase complex ATPase subunit type 1 TsaE [Ignavibacteria bacterium]
MSFKKEIISSSPEETLSAGEGYASSLKKNTVTGLYGNLGSGKTQFVKGICRHYNVNDIVSSPTFTIVNEYTGNENTSGSKIMIIHFDLYRLRNIKELTEIGIDHYVCDSSICVIEWPELADQYFKGDIAKIYFEHGKSFNERLIKF